MSEYECVCVCVCVCVCFHFCLSCSLERSDVIMHASSFCSVQVYFFHTELTVKIVHFVSNIKSIFLSGFVFLSVPLLLLFTRVSSCHTTLHTILIYQIPSLKKFWGFFRCFFVGHFSGSAHLQEKQTLHNKQSEALLQ